MFHAEACLTASDGGAGGVLPVFPLGGTEGGILSLNSKAKTNSLVGNLIFVYLHIFFIRLEELSANLKRAFTGEELQLSTKANRGFPLHLA